MRLLEMDQRSSAWELWRTGGIGASDAAVIYHGKLFDRTRDDLLEEKVQRSKRNSLVLSGHLPSMGNPPKGRPKVVEERMARGVRLEPVARETYIDQFGLFVRPICVVHDTRDWMLASLDGLSLDERVVLEIKCPSTDGGHQKVLDTGEIPWYYLPQVYHQLETTGAQVVHYLSFTDSERFRPIDRVVLVPIQPDLHFQEELVRKEEEFWNEVQGRVLEHAE